jgi:hypothetical protein
MDALAAGRDAAVQMIDTGRPRAPAPSSPTTIIKIWVVSRPDMTSSQLNYLAFVKLASIGIWLRANESVQPQRMQLSRITLRSIRATAL